MLSGTLLQQAESQYGWTLTQCTLIRPIFPLISGVSFECKLKLNFNPIDVVRINWSCYWVETAIHHFEMEWQLNCYYSDNHQHFFNRLLSVESIISYWLLTLLMNLLLLIDYLLYLWIGILINHLSHEFHCFKIFCFVLRNWIQTDVLWASRL